MCLNTITFCVYGVRILFRLRLKLLREKAGYSQYSFADAFGVSQSAVGNWEAGKREPNYETTERLADFFDVTIDYLLGRSTEPYPAQLLIPDILKEVKVAFHKGGEGFTQEEIDNIADYALFVRKQKEDRDRQRLQKN